MPRVIAVYLTNRTAALVPPYPKDEITPYVSYYPPGVRFMPRFRMGAWNGKITLLKWDKMPSGLFRALQADLEKDLNVRFEIEPRQQAVVFRDGLASDRKYQNECVSAMVASASAGGGLVLGATGSGKTRTTGIFLSKLKGKACFIVDELTLLHQAQEELEKLLGEKVGQVGNSIFDPQRITVATVQTMHRHREDPRFEVWTKELAVLVIDEIHIQMNRQNFETVKAIEPPAVYGLTATLELKKKHVRLRAYALAGPVLYEYPLSRGTAEGYLAQAVVTRVRFYNPCKGSGDYMEQYRDEIVGNSNRNNVIMELVKEAYRRDKYSIVLVERIAHLNALSRLCSKEGIAHRVVCGLKSVEDRVAAKQEFEAGELRLILANKVFKKGVDIKRVDVIIDAAGLKSKNDAVQKLGRGLRLCEGKIGLLYFDIWDMGTEGHGKRNRFEAAAKSRARALKAAGVDIVKWSDTATTEWAFELFSRVEKRLKVRVDAEQNTTAVS